MNFIFENWSFVLKGLLMTLQLALVVLLFTTLISAVLGVLATVKNRVLWWTIHAYVELFRSIPLIVNVFFIFFGAPMFGVDLSPFAAVTVGLTLWAAPTVSRSCGAGWSRCPATSGKAPGRWACAPGRSTCT